MTQIIITIMTMIVIMLTLLPSRKVEILSASTSPLEEPPSMPRSTTTKMKRWVWWKDKKKRPLLCWKTILTWEGSSTSLQMSCFLANKSSQFHYWWWIDSDIQDTLECVKVLVEHKVKSLKHKEAKWKKPGWRGLAEHQRRNAAGPRRAPGEDQPCQALDREPGVEDWLHWKKS